MHVLIAHPALIPVAYYGGTERVIWYLGKELAKMGHRVSFLVQPGSTCEFAQVLPLRPGVPWADQIPKDVDVVHCNAAPREPLGKPYLVTEHGNRNDTTELDINTVFVSQNHAERFGSDSFVHNGLDWDDYGPVDLTHKRRHFHFLGKAAWRVKNVRGAIRVVLGAKNEKLAVLGGTRLNLSMGFRFTLSPRIHFHGMVGGAQKLSLLQASRGLLFPVRWNEPFGLALTESLYFGCPVLGTPYGSLPEIVIREVGVLSNRSAELTRALLDIDQFSRKRCHEYARDLFDAKTMARAYLRKYESVMRGESLNRAPPKLQVVQTAKFLDWS